MAANRVLHWLFLVAFTVSACAISRKRIDQAESAEDAGVSDSSGNTPSEDAGVADTDSDTARSGVLGSQNARCGNGAVDGDEACDDGNLDEQDGCTRLCRFTCESDADCNDLNPCNGVERCTDYNVCEASSPSLEDGTECGQDQSCWRGVCVQNVCGDAKRDRGEQCDDGDLDPHDGCTPDCEFTCEHDGDCTGNDECLREIQCRDNGQHGGLKVCVAGTPLKDETACEIRDARLKTFCGDPDVAKDGWCQNGICTCSDCGDGEINGDEQCDDGLLNGTTDSPNHCSVNCQIVACQNGIAEGNEECDDGNDQPMDGCDPECKYEFAHAITNMRILKHSDVPQWCEHRNNRFAEAFTDDVVIPRVLPTNILETANQYLNDQLSADDRLSVLHIIDSDDTSMATGDDDITVGLYEAYAYPVYQQFLDALVVIYRSSLFEDTLLPAEYHAIPAVQTGGGRIFNREPTDVEMIGVTGSYLMRDFMMQLVFDLDSLSRPSMSSPVARDLLSISDQTRLPEVAGRDPMGLFCGAIEIGSSAVPVLPPDPVPLTPALSTLTSFCCRSLGDQAGTPYHLCTDESISSNELVAYDCDSMIDIIHEGCTICVDPWADYPDPDKSCELMQSNPEWCHTVIKGIAFDVDADGDGRNDSWSALFGFETQRIRIYDTALR